MEIKVHHYPTTIPETDVYAAVCVSYRMGWEFATYSSYLKQWYQCSKGCDWPIVVNFYIILPLPYHLDDMLQKSQWNPPLIM